MRFLPLVTSLAALFLPQIVRAEDPVSFRNQIAPILIESCVACHGPKKAEGGYRVDTYERTLKEGESGPGFTPAKLDASEAWRRMTSDDKDERMPKDADKLPEAQLALVKRWVEEGAKLDGAPAGAQAPLASIVPPPKHRDPPEAYPRAWPIMSLAFRPDGAELFAGGYHEVTVWNPADGALLRRIKNVGERVYGLSMSPNGQMLAVACGAPGRLGEVRLFDVASGNLLRVLGSTGDVTFDVQFSADGTRLASCGADNAIRVFDPATGDQQLLIESHADWVTAIAWSPDGTKLASASRDKTAKLFDAKTGEPLVTYSEHAQPVRGVAFHPGNALVFSAGEDNRVRLWQTADAKKTAELTNFAGAVFKLTQAGNFLFAPSADKSAHQFDITNNMQVRAFPAHGDAALACAYHAATNRLATGSFDGEVRISNVADGAQIAAFKALPGLQTAAK